MILKSHSQLFKLKLLRCRRREMVSWLKQRKEFKDILISSLNNAMSGITPFSPFRKITLHE
jgi:hypothetical protein